MKFDFMDPTGITSTSPMPFMPQQNIEWLVLLVPLHWALARHFRRLAVEATRNG